MAEGLPAVSANRTVEDVERFIAHLKLEKRPTAGPGRDVSLSEDEALPALSRARLRAA